MEVNMNSNKTGENKKAVWVHDTEDEYVMKYVQSEDISTVTCCDGSTYKTDDVFKVNSKKLSSVDDLAQLSYLNEPSVLDTLKNRYEMDQIYTTSGMFMVSVNPYKPMDEIYSDETKRKIEIKKHISPHIYMTINQAYDLMVGSGVNQSILITGESGAGKTENTKKIIEYLSYTNRDNRNNVHNLLLRANPLIEAFGNTKTVKNENSSRFGKFIRVFFANKMIVGGKIEKYLLEVSRITSLGPNERSYHIFYYVLNAPEEIKSKLHLTGKTYRDFAITRDGAETAHGIDDEAECLNLISCFKLFNLDFMAFFRIIAGIMHMSNLKFADGSKPEVLNSDLLKMISELLEFEPEKLAGALFNPKLVAGREIVNITRTGETSQKLVEAFIKNLYSKLFSELIDGINKSFQTSTYETFIGILDIAGFEIFKENSFEQLLINYTNEKLQQYFNTKMFEEEQRVYKAEGIEWDYIDFGLDLEPCIRAIESNNPIGVLSYLDEECVMPGATDQTVITKVLSIKITNNQSGQVVTKIPRNNTQFSLKHYAGDVMYTVENWIDKNKHISSEEVDELIGKISDSKKKGIFRTVAQGHREQLRNLMTMLGTTRPHFVRCILPNLNKRAGMLDKRLILDQLKCNGILEGLRISRLGYPSRLTFTEVCNRYNYIVDETEKVPKEEMCHRILAQFVKKGFLDQNDYKTGKSRIFFKQGILGDLEEKRLLYLTRLAEAAQGVFRYRIELRKKNYEMIYNDSIQVICKNVSGYVALNRTLWWKLYKKVKPLIEMGNQQLKVDEFNKKIGILKEQIEKLTDEKKYKDSNIETLKNRIVELSNEVESTQTEYAYKLNTAEELNQGLRKLVTENVEKFKSVQNDLINAESEKGAMSTNITNLNEEIVKQKKEMGMQQSKMDQLEKSIKINEQNLATKQAENSDLKKQLESERLIQAQSGESSKKEFNRMITAKETEISEMKNSLKLAEENNQAMAKEVDSLKNSTVSIEEENEKVKSEIQDKIDQIAQMTNSLEKSTKENKELRNQFALETEQSSKIVTRLRIELRESGKLVEELQSQGNKAKNTEYELLSRLEEAEADLKHAKAKCDQAQSSFAALVADTTRSQADEATLAEAAALRDRMAKMEAQIRRLKEDKEEIAAENTQMASDKMQSLIKHEAEMKTVRNSLTLQISRLKQENAKMQEELNASDDSPDTTLLLEERRRSMAIISGLELKNIDLLSKLESIDVDHLEREVDDIRNSVTEILRTFTGGIRGIIESDLLKIEDLHSIEQRICNRIRAEYDDRIARLQRAYDTLVSTLNGPNQLNDAKTSIQRLKIEQLERNSKLQHSTIEMMSQAMVFMKKKKGGSTSNKSVGE